MQSILVSSLISLIVGMASSVYAGAIVARYMWFDAAINRARSIILNLDQQWQYRYLSRAIPDPESPSGRRTVFMSRDIASNAASWQLTQVGLDLKELGHWNVASVVDGIWNELDILRDDFLSKPHLLIEGSEQDITPFIADWHRTLSRQKPNLWHILRPWSRKRYEHMSCVSVDETTGDWREDEPLRGDR